MALDIVGNYSEKMLAYNLTWYYEQWGVVLTDISFFVFKHFNLRSVFISKHSTFVPIGCFFFHYFLATSMTV